MLYLYSILSSWHHKTVTSWNYYSIYVTNLFGEYVWAYLEIISMCSEILSLDETFVFFSNIFSSCIPSIKFSSDHSAIGVIIRIYNHNIAAELSKIMKCIMYTFQWTTKLLYTLSCLSKPCFEKIKIVLIKMSIVL